MQSIAITTFLIWSAITAAIFVFVARSGRSPGELPLKAYKLHFHRNGSLMRPAA
jgi:hypothetical protein